MDIEEVGSGEVESSRVARDQDGGKEMIRRGVRRGVRRGA